MAQQTAVDWLVEQLARKHNEFQALTFYYDHKEEIEKAKAMEKEQIVNAFEQGIEFAFPTNGSYYYNQTYNQNK